MVRNGLLVWVFSSIPVSLLVGRMASTTRRPDPRPIPATLSARG